MFKSKKQRTMSRIVCGIYLALLTWLILFKFSTNFVELDHIRNINFVPFKESMIVNGRLAVKEIIYNVMVFVPLGVYVAMFKSEWSFGKKIIPAFGLSLIFETLQFIFSIGASDITDVIGNTLGGIIGIICFALFKKSFKDRHITLINSIGLVVEIFAMAIFILLFVANM